MLVAILCFVLLTRVDGGPLRVRPELIAIITDPLEHQCKVGTLIYVSVKTFCVKETAKQIEGKPCDE